MKIYFYEALVYLIRFLQLIPDRIRYFCYKKIYKIPNDFRFNGARTKIYGEGQIFIGNKSYCGEGCSFQLKKNASITIGSNCAISHGVKIYTANKDPGYIISGGKRKINLANVKIGNNVWIGANVFITEGVVIGDNVVVGANSVVTRDLPEKTVCAGSPCKVIKSYTE